jgi:hypothetical protein
MHPVIRLRLAHPEQAPMERLNSMLLEVDQHEQQPIFRCQEGAVLRGRVSSRPPAPSMKGPCGPVWQERRLKGGNQRLKLVHGQARQISHVSGVGWNVAIP